MTIRQVRINDVVHDIAVGLNSENSTNLIQTNTTPVEARENLGFTYGDVAPTETPITGEGSVYFMNEASEIPLPIPEGGTGAVNTQGAIENLGMYPVGAQYVTSTNTNPSAWLGGSWELVDKSLAYAEYTSSDGTYMSFGSVNSLNFAAIVSGNNVQIRIQFYNTSAIADTTYTVGTIDWSSLGFSEIVMTLNYIIGASDAGGGVFMASVNAGTGAVTIGDIVGKSSATSIAAASNCYMYFSAIVPKEYMLDSACDKFFWKRVA